MVPAAEIQVLESSLLGSDWPHQTSVFISAASFVDKGISVWGLAYILVFLGLSRFSLCPHEIINCAMVSLRSFLVWMTNYVVTVGTIFYEKAQHLAYTTKK